MSPDDPRHGTNAGHKAHVRAQEPPCRPCLDAAARYEQMRQLRIMRGQTPKVPAAPTQRRLQALMVIGWTTQEIAEEIGCNTGSAVSELLREINVRRATADAVTEAYRRLHMTPGRSAITTKRAKANGWLPPLAWEDIEAGERAGWQRPIRGYDHAVVERILGGDWKLAKEASRKEKAEVVARWTGSGNDLERLTGWNIWRDKKKGAA